MGIQGLLPLLKDIQELSHVSRFKGQAVGIDTYCWLHKGTYGCAKDLVLGKPTKAYVQYVMRRVNMLVSYGLKPILVFDGGHLPAKAEKEKERRTLRNEYKTRGLAALRDGYNQQAFECFQKCCDVTPRMASEVIKECFNIGVQCIVAPYEADAQLAYLMKENITQLTISEDSDLLLYGCNKVLYKMSAEGEGYLIDLANLSKVRSVQLASFTFSRFRHMCMLSGCDYLPSVKGFGLKKAHQALKKHGCAYQCIRFMKCGHAYSVPVGYEERFRKAEVVFKYQLVFDPKLKKVVPLNEVDQAENLSQECLDYAGPPLNDSKAIEIALGNIDPISGDQIGSLTDFASDKKASSKSSTWLTTSKPVNTKCAFQYIEKRKHVSTDEISSSPITSSADCTPVSQERYNEDRTVAKCLDDVLPTVKKSPHSEASKSLKRLETDEVLNKSSDSTIISLKKLYNDTQSKPLKHHSVFLKKKASHKFKNPFRVQENDGSPKKAVKSRYFGGTNTEEEGMDSTPPGSSPLREPLTFSKDISPPSASLNCSFVKYLDANNLSMSSAPKKRLTLSDSPQKVPKQRKLDTSRTITTHEDDKHKKKSMFKPVRSQLTERLPLSPIEKNVPSIDFSIVAHEFVDPDIMTVTDNDENKDDKLDIVGLDKEESLTQSHRIIKLKIGLSKNKCGNVKRSAGSLFEKFSNVKSSSALEQNIKKVKCDDSVEVIYSDEEEVLPKKLSHLSKIGERKSMKGERNSLLTQCKPIGLTKKHRSKVSKTSSNSKQTQLTLDKFKFAKKVSVL